jgi:predicted nucleic acid-binding Zn ribbon protein
MKCTVCNTDFIAKRKDAKYCSDKCRKQAQRPLTAQTPGFPANDEAPHSEMFYGTYANPDQTWDRGCVICGQAFETPLQLMRFCSEECKKDVYLAIANGPHKGFKL